MLNVIKYKWITLGISAAIIIVGIISFFVQGFNLDIDFTGGTEIYMNMNSDFDNDEVGKLINDTLGFPASSIQKAGDNFQDLIVKISAPNEQVSLTEGQVNDVVEAIKAQYPDAVKASSESIDATIGSELSRSAFWATLIALVLMLLYISFRFELWSGIAAIISLAQNVLVMMSIYSLFQFNIGTTFIAAILTIVGYSINDTIVTFDRIREIKRFSKKVPFADIINCGVTECIRRSVYTSVTTLLTIIILYFIGVTSIKDFALPIIIGIVAGTYSSIFIASPMWAIIKGEAKLPQQS